MKDSFYTPLVRLHLLHHADKEGSIFGLGMIEELRRHGYRLSPGTLYPILHKLEEIGYLKSHRMLVAGKARRGYSITSRGRKELIQARHRVRELFGELFEEDVPPPRLEGKRRPR
jgi:PadR family transcriptional regulator PadR